jgi:hypothetical protein
MHDQCFDLMYFVQAGGGVKCPVCSVGVEVKEFRVDKRFLRLMERYKGAEGCFVDSEGRDWSEGKKMREGIRID